MATRSPIQNKPGVKAPMPVSVSPMLCALTREVVQDDKYVYEIKWDGYRIISYVQQGRVRMDSRSALDYTKKYPPVAQALKELKHDVVLDGEVVVFNEEGLPDFDALQLYNGHDHPIAYCVFDLLWLDGRNLMGLPLSDRKSILLDLLKGNKVLRFSESYPDGEALYRQMLDRNLEGIIAKRKNSLYVPGERANNWLKTPTRKRQEFVIGGWAESSNGRAFKSLLFGAYENKQLQWIGRSGGGYKEKEMPGILTQLKGLETHASPFANKVLDTKGAVTHWVKPELVANFEFATWTKTGRIRKPATFLGFRKDKKARQVVREVPKELKDASSSGVEQSLQDSTPKYPVRKNKTGKKLSTMAGSNWPFIEQQNRDDRTEFDMGECTIDLFHVDRELWKGFTKGDLIQHYHRISPYILPHIHDRPQSLHFKIHGPMEKGYYVKDMEGRQPGCGEIFSDQRRHEAAGKRKFIDYLVCNNEATLLWMINMGCIDVNPWNSRVQIPDQPDWIVIDLDPSEEKLSIKGLSRLRTTAMAAGEYCALKKLKVFAKTSGKTGLHFLVPCSGLKSAEARALGEQICAGIHELAPNDSTISVNKAGRAGKVFVDFSQNDYADTISAPYCVRPFAVPLVSTPLELKEINAMLDPRKFELKTIVKRLEKKGDLFEKITDQKISIANNKILHAL